MKNPQVKASAALLGTASLMVAGLAGCSGEQIEAISENIGATLTRPLPHGDSDTKDKKSKKVKKEKEEEEVEIIELTPQEARALDAQGLTEGVISRGPGYTIIREGSALIVQPDSTGGSGTTTVSPSTPSTKPKPKPPTEKPGGGEEGGETPTPGPGGGEGGGETPGPGPGGGEGGGEVPGPGPGPGEGGGEEGGETPGPGPGPGEGGEGGETEQEEQAAFDKEAVEFADTIRFKIAEMINAYRAENNLPPLVVSVELSNSAQESASTATPNSSLPNAGYYEDIDSNTRPGSSNRDADFYAKKLYDLWMEDDEDKAILLSDEINAIGVGISFKETSAEHSTNTVWGSIDVGKLDDLDDKSLVTAPETEKNTISKDPSGKYTFDGTTYKDTQSGEDQGGDDEDGIQGYRETYIEPVILNESVGYDPVETMVAEDEPILDFSLDVSDTTPVEDSVTLDEQEFIVNYHLDTTFSETNSLTGDAEMDLDVLDGDNESVVLELGE